VLVDFYAGHSLAVFPRVRRLRLSRLAPHGDDVVDDDDDDDDAPAHFICKYRCSDAVSRQLDHGTPPVA